MRLVSGGRCPAIGEQPAVRASSNGGRLINKSKDKMIIGILCCAFALLPFTSLHAQSQPLVDYHQQLFSTAVAKLSPGLKSIDASDLIALLDSAAIRRALALSVDYQFGNPNKPSHGSKTSTPKSKRRTIGPADYGSDGYGGGNPAPLEAWAAFLQLPLSDDEFRIIASNIAPCMN